MGRAIIAVSVSGIDLARRINYDKEADIYTLDKYADNIELLSMNDSLKDFMGGAFKKYSQIIMIMSCGIAVRSISPYVQSKHKDPAVVVIDDLGKHVISLLSGHIGGANSLTQEIAKSIEAVPVITTASDLRGIEAVDTMAQRLELVIEDFEVAKKVTASLVNGEATGLFSDINGIKHDRRLMYIEKLEKVKECNINALIYIGYRDLHELDVLDIPVVKLIKRDLVLGIGCRKGINSDRILEAFESVCKTYCVNKSAIRSIATIELKKNEEGIKKLSAYLNVPIDIIDTNKIAEVEKHFECSDLVRRITGVGCVAEPTAYISSEYGSCVVPKTKLNGITMSIYCR